VSDVAIEVAEVSKRFKLYHEKYTSLKERAIHLGRMPYEEFWALRDIELEVKQGQTIGLLGHNGSGKSTLLKCIAGILQPTSGQIRTVGRMVALLELGAGFHPDLSGRENVFLNASVLGLSRRDVMKRFDDIVAFAELEQFIDNQVKYYSSGMYVRLGFAVAINMDPDILLVDEVLAVGDEMFQRKCLDQVKQFQREGRTIVFVTHAADLVRQVCNEATVLDQGRQVVPLVQPGEAVRSFREHLLQRHRYDEADQLWVADADDAVTDQEDDAPASPEEKRTQEIKISDVEIRHPGVGKRPYLEAGESLDIVVNFDAAQAVDQVDFGIAIYNVDGRVVFGSRAGVLGGLVDVQPGKGQVTFSFPAIPLLDGTYPFTLGILSGDGGVVYDWREQQYQFEILSLSRSEGMVELSPTLTVSTSHAGDERRAG
jgi:ABC-2 type transport system ATP-binding protein